MAKKSIGILISTTVLFLLAGVLYSYWQYFSKPAPLSVYSIIEKKYVQIPEKSGRPAVVLFWATWCGPCKIEMQRLQMAIRDGLIPPGQIYAVSIGESIEQIESYAAQTEFQFQFFADPDRRNIATYKVSGTPTTYHFNDNGEVIWAATGLDPQSVIRAGRLFQN